MLPAEEPAEDAGAEGRADGQVPDARGTDASAPDASASDVTVADSATTDAAPIDVPTPDTSPADSPTADTFVPDVAVDAGAAPCAEPGGGLYGGHCYFVINGTGSWGAARDACAARSTPGHPTHLATLTSAGEWSFTTSLAPSIGFGRWVGLAASGPTSSKSKFGWLTGEPVTYEQWMSGHPDASGSCVVQHSATFAPPNAWEDVPCSSGYAPLCERE